MNATELITAVFAMCRPKRVKLLGKCVAYMAIHDPEKLLEMIEQVQAEGDRNA